MVETINGMLILWAFGAGVVMLTGAYFALLIGITNWMWSRTMPAARKAFLREYFYKPTAIVDGQDDTFGRAAQEGEK